ncbi:MAG: hypothetical protein K2L97_07000 [Muribaculaceae bacterium]|nr:hypothetical protein [Muribaculaceae bacterium]
MKKLLLLMTLMVTMVGAIHAQNQADFDTMNGGKVNSGYSSYTSNDGWNAVNCALVKSADTENCLAPTLNGKTSAVGKVTSPTLYDGIGTISFDYTNTFSESKGVKLEISIIQNGEVVSSTQLVNTSVTQKQKYSFSADFNIEGEFTIEIKNLSPSNNAKSNKDRVSIWNLTWTNYPNGGDEPLPLGEIIAYTGDEYYAEYIHDGDDVTFSPGTTLNISCENAKYIRLYEMSPEINGVLTYAEASDSKLSYTFQESFFDKKELYIVATNMEPEETAEKKELFFRVNVQEPYRPFDDIFGMYEIPGEDSQPINNGDTLIDIPVGTVFTFTNETADLISISGESVSESAQHTVTWRPDYPIDKQKVTVTASRMMEQDKVLEFWVNVIEPVPVLGNVHATYIGPDEVLHLLTVNEVEVEVNTEFTFHADNAAHISVSSKLDNDGMLTIAEADGDTVSYTFTEGGEYNIIAEATDADWENFTSLEFHVSVIVPPVPATDTYVKISSMDEFTAGYKYILVGKSANKFAIMGKSEGKYRAAVSVNSFDDSYLITEDMEVSPFVIEEYDGAYSLKLENDKYISVASTTATGNTDLSETSALSGNTKFSITFEDEGNVKITNNVNYIQYNATSPRFKTYSSKQSPVYLYKYTVNQPIFDQIIEDPTKVSVMVTSGELHVWTIEYDVDGNVVKENDHEYDADAATANSLLRVPATGWTNKVKDANEPHYIAVPTTEDNILEIRSKAVVNGYHSEEVVTRVNALGDLISGITDVAADDVNAPVEYFNMQGMRVNADQPGLYIRRQGNQVSKVVIR